MCNLEYCTVISQCGNIHSANKKCAWCISVLNNSPCSSKNNGPTPTYTRFHRRLLYIPLHCKNPHFLSVHGDSYIPGFAATAVLNCYKWLRYAVQSQLFSIRHTFKIVKEQCLYTYSQPLLTEYRASYITIWDGIVFTKDGIATLASSKLDRVGIMD